MLKLFTPVPPLRPSEVLRVESNMGGSLMTHLCIPREQVVRENRKKLPKTYQRPEIRSLEKQEWIDYMLAHRIRREDLKVPQT